MSDDENDAARFALAEDRLDYTFTDRSLLARALRHPSAVHELSACDGDNQRLEFLGDAVLGLLAADTLYARHADLPEGRLTVLRAQVASGKALARMAKALDLGALLEMGHGEEQTGGRQRSGNLADALEALVGAVWLDGGLDAARHVFEHIVGDELHADGENLWKHNPKGELQELCQRRWRCEPTYQIEERSGADHTPHFRVSVHVAEMPELSAEGEGSGKQAAEVAAATNLLTELLAP